MAKNYESVLDEISKLLEVDGHKAVHASFNKDKVFFGSKETQKAYEQSDARMKSLNQTPVGQKETSTQEEGISDKQLEKEYNTSKQLKLPASSTIQSAAYWPTKQYLLVSFKSGHTYSYDDVPQATIDLWQFASSAGSWFYYNIRTSYSYTKQG